MATRPSKEDLWGTPVKVGPPVGLYDACTADVSADRLSLYFASDERPGGYGNDDLWVAKRATIDDEWGEPVNLGPNVNNTADQYSPSISNDDLALFYNNGGLHHISMATRATMEDPWGPPVLLSPSINNIGWVIEPEISPDGSILYFDSGRSGGFNKENFWQVSIKPVVDFNGDGNINTNDLLIMIDNWGSSETLCDIGPMPWGDGIVDMKDLEVFMGYWEKENMPQEPEDQENGSEIPEGDE